MTFRLLQPQNLVILFSIPFLIYLLRRSPTPISRSRKNLSLVLRTLVILLLALSLSGLSFSESIDRVNLMFLLDMSDSLDEGSRAFV